jgi:peroxiredoxin
MSLQEKLSAFKKAFQSGQPPFAGIPPEVHALMQRATDGLTSSGATARVPGCGEQAPLFELQDEHGRVVRLADLIAAGPVVLSFYRGVWCPYCNIDLQELELHARSIRAAGAALIAVTPQTAVNSRKLIADHNLTFPILSDPGNAVAERYGLRYRLPDYLIAVYRQLGVELPVINGNDDWTLPIPARFVVGSGGRICYAEANPDYTVRPEPEKLLRVLEELKGSLAA